uniref:Uncharacterized protein n=1 Tax=CrAss-like virus sp. ctYsL76 TaxID=2826826 RepID=A0A8S5QL26_9CAUD|nr:MAG TPA: hypothetical protein [CrAss-like virus sp. ctYsL76]
MLLKEQIISNELEKVFTTKFQILILQLIESYQYVLEMRLLQSLIIN